MSCIVTDLDDSTSEIGLICSGERSTRSQNAIAYSRAILSVLD